MRRTDAPTEGTLNPADSLARFLKSKNYFAASTRRVKPGAFLPRPNPQKSGRLETSVFRIDQLSEDEIRALAAPILQADPGVTVYGRAETTVEAVHQVGLAIEADDVPPRHANIIGWPSGEDQKELRRMRALELADRAVLKLHE